MSRRHALVLLDTSVVAQAPLPKQSEHTVCLAVLERLGTHGSTVLALILVLLAVPCSLATAAGWSRPVSVTSEPAEELPEFGFVQSPDDLHTFLIDRSQPGIRIWRLAGRHFGRPWRVPRSADAVSPGPRAEWVDGQFPVAAANDRGGLVIAWTQVKARARTGSEIDECFCDIRSVVLRPNARYGPVKLLAPATAAYKPIIGAQIGPDGVAGVLWESVVSNEPRYTLHLALTTPQGSFLAPRQLGEVGSAIQLQELEGRVAVLYYGLEAAAPLTLLAPPAGPALLGPLHELGEPGGQTLFISNRRGGELAIAASEYGLRDAYRPPGGVFGDLAAYRAVTKLGPPGASCDLNAATNEHGETIVGWACVEGTVNLKSPPVGGAALLGPEGEPLDITKHSYIYPERPALAIGDSGDAVVAWHEGRMIEGRPSDERLISVTAVRGHFSRYRTIAHEPTGPSALAVTANGSALATWLAESAGGKEDIRAARLKVGPPAHASRHEDPTDTVSRPRSAASARPGAP